LLEVLKKWLAAQQALPRRHDVRARMILSGTEVPDPEAILLLLLLLMMINTMQ
jgi:hypothetical protein